MARIACDLSDILTATKAKLVGAGIFTDLQCFLTVEPDEILKSAKVEPPVAGLTFVAFSQRPDTFHSEMEVFDDPTMEGDLTVALWIRSGTDQPARDESFLTNPTIGATQLIAAVCGALNNSDLETANGDTLLWRTFNYNGVAQRGRWSTDKRWRRVDVRFNCVFEWKPQEVQQRNLPYGSLSIGQPPSCYRYALFGWTDQYERIRLRNVPLARGTTYYFSQSGDDVTGDGSEANPWKTLVKAQAVLDAAPATADLRLRFKRGDVWRELTVLTIAKNEVTIDDYGEPIEGAPLFTRFTTQYTGGSSWTLASGNRYTTTNTGVQGWLRDADDIENPYWEQTEFPAVGTTPRSFYHNTATDTLHVNAGVGVNPNSKQLEYAPLDLAGWYINNADNVRLENLRIHGVGMHVETTSSYGLQVNHANTTLFQEAVLVNVEVLYAGYHAIGHIGQSGGQSITMIGCKAGYCTNRATGGDGVTPYVSFATSGGQELYMRDCEVTSGMLPSAEWGATGPTDRTQTYGVLQHTGSGTDYAALSIVINTKFPDNPWQIIQTTSVGCAPFTTDEATQLRAYIIDERPVADGLGGVLGYGVRDRVWINCAYHWTGAYKPAGPVSTYLWQQVLSVLDFDGLSINCKASLDVSNLINGGVGTGFWSGAAGAVNMRLENCRLEVVGITNALDYFQCVTALSATMGSRINFRNTVVTLSGTGLTTARGGFMGAADLWEAEDSANNMVKPGSLRLVNNGYFLCEGSGFPHTATYLDGDPGAVRVYAAIPDTAPIPGDPLHYAGAANGLEYDFNRFRRTETPSIGPLEV